MSQNIIVKSTIQALEYLEISIATNDNEMALLIKTPVLDPRIFKKMHFFPILQDKKQIHFTNRRYLAHPTGNYIVKTLESKIFDQSEIQLDVSECIPKLLNGDQAKCNFTLNPNEEEIISLDDQYILVVSNRNQFLETNCGINNRNLSGSYLITYHNCSVSLNKITFSRRKKHISGLPVQLPLDKMIIDSLNSVTNLSLEHLDKLHWETRRELNHLQLKSNSLHWATWSIFGGTFPLSIFGIITLIFYIYRNNRIKMDSKDTVNVKLSTADEIRYREPTIQDVMNAGAHQ